MRQNARVAAFTCECCGLVCHLLGATHSLRLEREVEIASKCSLHAGSHVCGLADRASDRLLEKVDGLLALLRCSGLGADIVDADGGSRESAAVAQPSRGLSCLAERRPRLRKPAGQAAQLGEREEDINPLPHVWLRTRVEDGEEALEQRHGVLEREVRSGVDRGGKAVLDGGDSRRGLCGDRCTEMSAQRGCVHRFSLSVQQLERLRDPQMLPSPLGARHGCCQHLTEQVVSESRLRVLRVDDENARGHRLINVW